MVGLRSIWFGFRAVFAGCTVKTQFQKCASSALKRRNIMPEEAMMHDPMAYRYFDYPRTGSIYRLPDIPMLVRGKTYVTLPSGRDIEVDPQFARDEHVPAAQHENGQANSSLEHLLKQLTGQRTEGPPPGFKAGGLFDHNTQTPLLHAHEGPRRAHHNGLNFNF